MTEKEQKSKSGAGKFFLGAAIGAAIGAIASKFINLNVTSDDDDEPVEDEAPKTEAPKAEKPKEEKKPATKKPSEKKWN